MNSERIGMGTVILKPEVDSTTSKTCYGTYKNVWLRAEEIEKFRAKYANSDEMIESLSRFKFNKKRETVSDYDMLLMFGRKDGQIR